MPLWRNIKVVINLLQYSVNLSIFPLEFVIAEQTIVPKRQQLMNTIKIRCLRASDNYCKIYKI